MAVSQDFNPFANQAVHVPKAYHEVVDLYSTTFGSKNPEDAPFKRFVDFWLLAAAVGASQGQYMAVDSIERHDFITGAIFQRDLATIEFLFLLAIAHSDDPFVVRDPRQVLDIAEGYAAAGIPLVKEMMETGHLPALQNLTRSLVKSLADDSGATDG